MVSIAPNLVYIKAEFESPTGMRAETKDPWKILPNLFFTTPLKNERFAAGLSRRTS